MKNMKKFISIALITAALLTFVGCESTTTKAESNEDFYIAQKNSMAVIREPTQMGTPNVYHLVDKSTGVMYLYVTDIKRRVLPLCLTQMASTASGVRQTASAQMR